MEKSLQSKELLVLKALNRQEFNYLEYKFVNILSQNEDDSMNLQFKLLKRPNVLLPHLEPGMNVCYSSLDSRNIRSISEYDECKKRLYKIVETWKNYNIDQIVYEAESYLHSSLNLPIAIFSIDNDLQKGENQFTIVKENDEKILITDKIEKATFSNFEIVEMSGDDFVRLGYIGYEKFKSIVYRKKKKPKFKKTILKINGFKTYKFLYFDFGKSIKSISYLTIDNCRTSWKHSRMPLASALRNKKVMIIGLGAIGSHVAELIASFWPNEILLWDHDGNFSSSATRQNYSYSHIPSHKCLDLKKRLYKYKGINLTTNQNKFEESISTKNAEKFDYIIDCTGEGIIAMEFNEIIKYGQDKTIIAVAYIQKHLFTKICDLATLKQDGALKEWHQYDVNNNEKYSPHIIFKGCSETIEYSYLDVYLISTHLVSNIVHYKGIGYDFKEIDSLG